MINISLDEGYVFDILAILNVKISETSGQTKDKIIANFQNTSQQIKDQIGESLFNTIICSDEYKELYNANKIVFELVDKAKTDSVKASEVDIQNYERYLKKTRLQNKFFNSEVQEIKINYNENITK
jgi:nitrogenase subunit NifH